MRNTVLKGICQTLILMLALILISLVFLQLTLVQYPDSLESGDEFAPLMQELMDENGIVLPEEVEDASLDMSDDSGVVPADTAEAAPPETAANDPGEEYPTLLQTFSIKVIEDARFAGIWFFVLFLLIAMYLILNTWPLSAHDGKTRALILLNAGLYLACGAPFLFFGYTDKAVTIMNILYSAILAAESAIRLKKNHKPLHVVFRIALLLLMALNLNLFLSTPMFVLLLIALRSLEQILRISFSQIRLDVLRKIIRKTYASEILMGMILLMVAFSLVLSMLDENIGSFWDALWFCFATVTTIGYGDVTTTSTIGRILSVILGIYGIVVVALITSIIVNFYNEMKEEKAEE